MRVKPLKIELASDEKYHCAHGVNAGVATRLTFGRLKQTIEGFEETVGLPSLCPSHDAVEMAANHFSDLLHRLNF